MRYLYLFIPLLWSSVSFGQTERKMTPIHIPTNIERYQDDYELKNYNFVDGDSSILNSIDLDDFESMRQMDHDVEVEIEELQVVLILYSVATVGRKETGFNLTNQ